MRSYLLDAVAGGLGKCAPEKVHNVLVDSFIATLSIPESQEEVDHRMHRVRSKGDRPDEATLEAVFSLETKRTLQESALRHLLRVDEVKVESLLRRAEPDVRATLLSKMISRAASAKKFDRALALLSRVPSKEGFPYGEATQSLSQTGIG